MSPFDVTGALVVARQRIEDAGRDPATVTVIAVAKGFGADAVRAAAEAGLRDVGENYAQELLAKRAEWAQSEEPDGPGEPGEPAGPAPALRWHFLGAVQRNKVPALAPHVSCWQAVTRVVEGRAIAARRPGADIFVEVDVTGAPTRRGLPAGEVPSLVGELRDAGVRVRGLMTVAPRGAEKARHAFRLVRELADRLELPERSMGMSDDFQIAVAEGATMVRLGRGLFGDRPPRR